MPISKRVLSQFDLWFTRGRSGPTGITSRPGAPPVRITATALARRSRTGDALAPSLCPKSEADFQVVEGGYLALRDAQGCRVACHGGRLWITEQDRLDDGWLLTGQELTLSRPGKALIVALRDSHLSLR
jgi:hypothetical protein